MSQEDAEKLLRLVQQGKFGLSFWSYVILAAVTVASAATGAYVAARAENYAMSQDVGKLTRKVEDVRREISDASWQSQRIWEEKKLLYFQVTKLLDQADTNLVQCVIRGRGTAFNATTVPAVLLRDIERHKEIMIELRQTIAVSGIFLSPDAQGAVESFRREIGEVKVNHKTGEVTSELFLAKTAADFCHEMRKRAMKSRDAVVAAARADLAAGLGLPSAAN